MIIAHSVLSIPVAFLVIAAALKGFDRNLERAAMSAGAGPLRTFLWVTLPVLRPGILVGALFAFLHSFNEAVVAIFIAGRDASTLPKKMFESIRLESDPVIAVVSTPAHRRGAGRRAASPPVLPAKELPHAHAAWSSRSNAVLVAIVGAGPSVGPAIVNCSAPSNSPARSIR